MEAFDHLLKLPGTLQEQAWLKERLETLSVREGYALAAALEHCPPETMLQAASRLQSLDEYTVCYPAWSYEQLGEHYLRSETNVPEDALPYVDLYQMGQQYEDEHPGMFMEGCYVAYPDTGDPRQKEALPLEDKGWSVKLKLASSTVPEGVWIRLPCQKGKTPQNSNEILLALNDLYACSLKDCTLLDARCILPEAGNLMEQYSSITNLVCEGNILGHILHMQSQDEAYWKEKLFAALDYEDCHTLRFALDIAKNLHCYDWVPRTELADYAAKHLRACGVPDSFIHSGAIELEEYAGELLDGAGYSLADRETGYVTRNRVEFRREYTLLAEEPLQQDILKGIPWLERLSRCAGREEAAAAKAAITEALAGRGAGGLRQLQAAMDFEECSSLKQAVEIASQLDCYEFVEFGSFQETAEKELLAMGLDKELIDRCINMDAYAAVTHNLEQTYSYGADNAGFYVQRKDASPQLGQGMSMQ